MLKMIRFLQAPIRFLGRIYYLVEVAFLEGKYDTYRYMAVKYNDSEFK